MTNKLYIKIKELLKEYKWDILILLIVSLSVFYEFPYYINAPGGIENLDNKIVIKDEYESKGSFNVTFVSEYRANLLMMTYAYLNPNFDLYKIEEYLAPNETHEIMNYRNILEMEESIDNAVVVAYNKANEDITINKTDLYVTYIYKEANTNIEVGDKLISIDGIEFKDKEELDKVIDSHNIGDIIKIKVINEGKEYIREATIQGDEEDRYIGIYITHDIDYKVDRDIKFKVANNESGPSGGLMMSLEIYNSLTPNDITKGNIIAGTGTIDVDGNVGSISGIKYKIKSAVKKHADIFLVPAGENYDEAIELKEKYNYKIDIVPVENIGDAINYLNTL